MPQQRTAINNLSKLPVACDSDDNNPAPVEPPAPTITLQRPHASPDAPAVDVFADGAPLIG